jgi:hypothetical protein
MGWRFWFEVIARVNKSLVKFLELNRLGLTESAALGPAVFLGISLRCLFYAIPFLPFINLFLALDFSLIIVFALAIAGEILGHKKPNGPNTKFKQKIAQLSSSVLVPITAILLLGNLSSPANMKLDFYGVCFCFLWLSIICLEAALGDMKEKPNWS